MGKTKKPAWRNTERLPKKQSSYKSKTKECAWRNTNTQIPNKKLKPTHKLRDDDGDEELLDPTQKHCELVENVSSTSDSSLDDDSDDDVVIIDPKQVQCELAANVSPMSDSLLDDDDVEVSTSSSSSDSVSAEASKEIFSSVTSKAVDNIIEQKEIDTRDSAKEINVIDDDLPEWAQALEPVRKLPTKVGARIKRCIYNSLNRNPPEWAKEILKRSISKDVYKGNASGPTKRAVISVLEKVRVDIPQPKPTEEKEKELYKEELLDDDDAELSTSKQERPELVGNLSLMSDSLEKFSPCQSDKVYVQGYKVNRSIATILEAIFKKHGDIAANCVFKASSTRTHFLEVVCEIVRQIQTNDMTEMVKDVKCQLSDAEAANINVSWIRAHFDAFHKRKETSENYNMLMEMKSNTILVKQAAQVDLRETCAELMSAQERFKNAERCVRVLHLVEKNLNHNILESKAKLDSWVKHPVV